MKVAFVEDADPERVSETIQATLKSRGAILTEHTPSHIRFEGVEWPLPLPDESRTRDSAADAAADPPDADARAASPAKRDVPRGARSFLRGGYVGTYQHAGEHDVEVRLKVFAQGPVRWFWRAVVIELVIALIVIVWNPPATIWIGTAVLLYLSLALAFLVYVGTWRTSRRAEQALFDIILETLRSNRGSLDDADEDDAPDVETVRERRLRVFDEEIEAEVLKTRLESERKSAIASGARAADAGRADDAVVAVPADDADDEAKRARIQALRDEIAAQRNADTE